MEVHPNVLIFVEGIEMYPKDDIWDDEEFNTSPWFGTDDYYGNWWGGNLRGVRKYPINLGKHQKQLVYSPHDYGPIVFEQSWFRVNLLLQMIREPKKFYMKNAGETIGHLLWKKKYPHYCLENGVA